MKKWLIFLIALGLIAGTAGALTWLKSHQKLGKPGIKAEPISGNVAMKINLPERVAGFDSTNVPEPQVVLGYLPADTSYVERRYQEADTFPVYATVILMGADRTSIHSADYCLTGQGFSGKEKSVETISIGGAQPYELPVARWNVSGTFQQPDGQNINVHGVYVFWFVADGEQTVDNHQRMWWLGRDLFRAGVLQRWAYVSYFSQCEAGEEDAAFGRIKKLIAASAPEFQLPLKK